MEAIRLEYSYRETRLDVHSTDHQATTISIRLPTAVPSSFSGVKQSRSIIAITQNAEDEKTFRQRYIATSSSIYHRRHNRTPQSFLWRVIENQNVLSIRVVDLSVPSNVAEPFIYTLRFTFPHSILPTCIAFSDSRERDELTVYVLTDSKQIWTLSLRPDFFSNASSIDENITDWCNIYYPRSLGIKTPYRLVALNDNELMISFHDGALARLERSEDLSGYSWKEQQYNEGGWGHSFRSMVPFHTASGIYYEGNYVQPSAATSIASPANIIEGVTYIFTVTIDHRLRIWNLDLGRIAYSGDILTQELETQDEAKQIIDPSQSRLVQVISNNRIGIICITYSPLSSGVFKLWNVVAENDGNLTLIDLYPNCILTPPAPSSDIWTLADFAVTSVNAKEDKISIWILWKNNLTYQLLNLEFSTSLETQAQNIWNEGWKAVVLDQLCDIPIPKIQAHDPSDVTDKWLDFILFPGRFSLATIETGLAIYEQGLGMEKDFSCKSRSLVDRMCTSIASTAALARSSVGSLDFDLFRTTTHTQWMRFYRLLIDLHDQRGEALSLVIDPDEEMPWVTLADGLSIVRESTQLEKIWYKSTSRIDRNDRVSLLLFAAANFRNSIPETLSFSCNSFIREEIHQDPSLTVRTRMQKFYEKCDFATQIGDGEFEELLRNLDGDFTNITEEAYTEIIELLGPFKNADKSNRSSQQQISVMTKFGNQIIVKGTQQIIQLYRSICLDQLILLVLIENEIVNSEDEDESVIQIGTAPIYNKLISILSRLEFIYWLFKTQILIPGIKKSNISVAKSELSSLETNSTATVTTITNNAAIIKNSNTNSKGTINNNITKINTGTVTIFEGVLNDSFTLDQFADTEKLQQNMLSYVTKFLQQISTAITNNQYHNGNFNDDEEICDFVHYELSPIGVQCFLLKQDRPDLALDCAMRFLDNDYFPTYILGRIHLATMELSIAASLFKKAAVGMALSTPPKQQWLQKLHNYYQKTDYIIESEKKLLFGSGLAKYYFHVMLLFQKGQFYSYVIEFARLSHQFIGTKREEEEENILKQIHIHLFNAALYTARYDIAYSALTRFTNPTLQTTYLRTLIIKMCETSNASYLIEFPFVGMQDKVDGILSQKCQNTMDILSGISYHKILYAWRIKQNNFRGAASILLNRLYRLRKLGSADQIIESHQLETPITQQYISLINTLCCVDPKQAWILQEIENTENQSSMINEQSPKRKVITLSDLRNNYQAELDRLGAIHNNQFQFEGSDPMNIL